jgi:hypothetical protein
MAAYSAGSRWRARVQGCCARGCCDGPEGAHSIHQRRLAKGDLAQLNSVTGLQRLIRNYLWPVERSYLLGNVAGAQLLWRPASSWLCRAQRSSSAISTASLYVAVRRPESMTSSRRTAKPPPARRSASSVDITVASSRRRSAASPSAAPLRLDRACLAWVRQVWQLLRLPWAGCHPQETIAADCGIVVCRDGECRGAHGLSTSGHAWSARPFRAERQGSDWLGVTAWDMAIWSVRR